VKIAIGQRIQSGPWGGGNRFAAALAGAIEGRGDKVVFDLRDGDVDIIVLTDPRARNPAATFTAGAVLRTLMWRNPRALVVHRINECDERKGTRTMNARLRLANHCADHTVFIGAWLADLDVWRRGPSTVIHNGADPNIFNADGHSPWDGKEPLRLVTHHWGGHWLKGFDVYERLDAMLATDTWKNRIAFTYVGNLPAGFSFNAAHHLAPLGGGELAAELRRHHVYLTASVNEPAGMHHIEGALCGLPLLYRLSGALPEYCGGFGESFEGPETFEAALSSMIEAYPRWREKLVAYPNTSAKMCSAYLDLFDGMMASREEILAGRRPLSDPLAVLLNQIPW
jgi:hypothetical protein